MTCFIHRNRKIGENELTDDFSLLSVEIQINKEENLTKVLEEISNSPPEFQVIYPDIFIDYNNYSKIEKQRNYIYNELKTGFKKFINFYVIRYVYSKILVFFLKIMKYSSIRNMNCHLIHHGREVHRKVN